MFITVIQNGLDSLLPNISHSHLCFRWHLLFITLCRAKKIMQILNKMHRTKNIN